MFEQFKTQSSSRQIAIVLLAVTAVFTVLALVWLTMFRTPYAPAFTQLRSSDAAKIADELGRRKLPFRLEDGGSTILVPADEVGAARLAVAGGNLDLTNSVGFEIFNKSELGITDFAQKINFQRALQGELERTIGSIHHVETARVHLALGEDRAFRDDQVPPKAAVTLHMIDDRAPSAETVKGVQQLVSAAVPKLAPDDVVVVDDSGTLVSPRIVAQAPDASTLPFEEEKGAIERFFRARVRAAFGAGYDSDRFQVSVQADLISQPTAQPDEQMSATRDFPLTVSLTPAPGVSPEEMQQAQTLARNAIGYRADLGDVVRIGPPVSTTQPTVQPAWQGTSATRPPLPSSTPSPQPQAASLLGGIDLFVWLGLAVAVVVGLALLLLGRGSAPRLSDEERIAFSERLQRLMDNDRNEADGPSAI